jgi:hypothetical protein
MDMVNLLKMAESRRDQDGFAKISRGNYCGEAFDASGRFELFSDL